MNKRWLTAGAGGALLVGLLVTLGEQPRQPRAATTAAVTHRPAAPAISPDRSLGKPVRTAASAGECPDCKPGSVSFAPPIVADRLVGGPPRAADTSQVNRDHSLNARLARHLSKTQTEEPSPEQTQARAAQEKNLRLRGAAIERSGVAVGRRTRP